jgi:hypothetical protein
MLRCHNRKFVSFFPSVLKLNRRDLGNCQECVTLPPSSITVLNNIGEQLPE